MRSKCDPSSIHSWSFWGKRNMSLLVQRTSCCCSSLAMRDSMRPMDALGSIIMDPCIQLQVLQDEHLSLERPPSMPRDFRRFERVLDAVHHTVSFEGIERLVIRLLSRREKKKSHRRLGLRAWRLTGRATGNRERQSEPCLDAALVCIRLDGRRGIRVFILVLTATR